MKRSLLIIIPCITLLFCVKDFQNPFEVASNARALVRGKTFPGDTVLIYTTYTCTLMTTVAELIDSVSVHADDNRFWEDTVLSKPIAAVYRLSVSFADTGAKLVRITTWRKGGGSPEPELKVYAKSPLYQKDLTAQLGAVCTLKTDAVGDAGVWYHWNYGTGGVNAFMHSRYPEVNALASIMGNLSGTLWVSEDSLGSRKPSPVKTFAIAVNDGNPPTIVCMNDSLLGVHGDTVVTGNDPFFFQIYVRDEGSVKSLEINGEQYPVVLGLNIIRIADMALYARSYRPLIVAVRDNSGNVTVDTFTVYFDPSVAGIMSTKIGIETMTGDSAVTLQPAYLIGGTVKDLRYDSVAIQFAVGQQTPFGSARDLSLLNGQAHWWNTLELLTGWNTVRIRVTGGVQDSILAEKTVYINYDPVSVDTSRPVIMDVRCNLTRVAFNVTNYVSDTAVTVTFIAYDASGIQSAVVNGLPATPSTGQPGLWSRTIAPVRHDTTTPAVILVTDKTGKTEQVQFRMQKNLRPRLAAGMRWPANFIVDSQYTVTFSTIDDDQDTVWFEKKPAGMSVVRQAAFNTWSIIWKPAIADTGTDTAKLRIDDGILDTTLLWSFTVLKDVSLQVRFAPAGFPALLQTTVPWNDTLRLVKGTGKPPYSFRGEFVPGGTEVMKAATDSTRVPFTWTPDTADTGRKLIRFTVTDGYGDVATRFHTVLIVPKNADPCSVFVKIPDGLTIIGGAVDLRTTDTPVTIRFQVEDSDNPLVERHRFVIDGPGVFFFEQDSSIISYVIDPRSIPVERDTISVKVSDSTGTTFTAVVPLLFLKELRPFEVDSLKAWFDPARRVTFQGPNVAAQNVLTWGSSVPLEPSLTGESALQPVLIPEAANGLPVIRFDGTDGLLNYPNSALSGWNLRAFTIIIVASIDEINPQNTSTLLGSGYEYCLGVTKEGQIGLANGGVINTIESGCGLEIQQNKFSICTFSAPMETSNPKAIDMWLDGTAGTRLTMQQLGTGNGAAYFVIGSIYKHSSTLAWKGDIAEIIVYQGRTLSDLQRRGVERYLQRKYGLTGGR